VELWKTSRVSNFKQRLHLAASTCNALLAKGPIENDSQITARPRLLPGFRSPTGRDAPAEASSRACQSPQPAR